MVLGHERDSAALLLARFHDAIKTLPTQVSEICRLVGNDGRNQQRLGEIKTQRNLNERETIKALRLWDTIRKSSRIVEPVERVIEIASTLPDAYELRALDSFQLAAALVWCQEKPRGRPFITADERLAKAAEKFGFAGILLS